MGHHKTCQTTKRDQHCPHTTRTKGYGNTVQLSQWLPDTSCKNCNRDVHWKSMFYINEQPKLRKTGCRSKDPAWQPCVKALRGRFAWDGIAFIWRYEALSLCVCLSLSLSLSLSLYAPFAPPPPFSTDRPHRNTENNLTCSAMGLSSQGFQWELPVSERHWD